MLNILQEEQIRLLRSQGVGYRQIANRLNLSRDAVRYYCKANDLNGHREAVLSNTQCIKTDENFCSCCGELLVQPKTGRKRRFCCEACRRKWWGQNRDKVRKGPEAIYGFTCEKSSQPTGIPTGSIAVMSVSSVTGIGAERSQPRLQG